MVLNDDYFEEVEDYVAFVKDFWNQQLAAVKVFAEEKSCEHHRQGFDNSTQ